MRLPVAQSQPKIPTASSLRTGYSRHSTIGYRRSGDRPELSVSSAELPGIWFPRAVFTKLKP